MPPASPVKTADREDADGLDDHRVEADRARRGFGIAHRHHRHAPAAAGEAVERIERGARERDGEHGHLALRKDQRAERRRRDAHEAVGPAGERAPLDRAVLNNEGKGDRDHGEIGTGHAQCRQREREAHQAGDRARQRQCEPEVDALEGEDGDRVGADRVEADVAEGHLPGQPQQDVEPDADDRGQGDKREDERRVAV